MNTPSTIRSPLRKLVLVGLGVTAVTVIAAGRAAASPPSFVEPPSDPSEIVGAQPEAVAMTSTLRINGLFHKVVDEFEEACGLGSLRIEVGNNQFTTIARGTKKFLKPFNDPNDAFGGRFDWKCGTNLEHSECSDSPNGADVISVFWETNTRNIQITCFERCGDGSSASDCD